MSERSIIDISRANIYQKDKLILQYVNLQLLQGEFAYLIGRTGTGKTSLLKTLYGILPFKEGDGMVAGFDLKELNRNNIPFLRRKVGFIFQDFVLLKDRSVEDNLRFALEATGWTDAVKIGIKMQEVLDAVDLPNIGHRRPHELSGGEQQRVVIARALLNNPALIIADEATGNLDPETAEDIVKLLINLSETKQTAILFATHNYQLLERFPARIIKCQNGQLLDEVSMIY